MNNELSCSRVKKIRKNLVMERYWKNRKANIKKYFPNPVHPNDFDKFRKDNLVFIWRANHLYDFCTSCATTSPKVPKSHHQECCNYENKDFYEIVTSKIGICPSCNDKSSLYVESCVEMRQSIIFCGVCDYKFCGDYCEEVLVEKFKKEFKK